MKRDDLIIDRLKGHGACADALRWCRRTDHMTIGVAWDDCPSPYWLSWFIHHFRRDLLSMKDISEWIPSGVGSVFTKADIRYRHRINECQDNAQACAKVAEEVCDWIRTQINPFAQTLREAYKPTD